jgi:hypothetical protein
MYNFMIVSFVSYFFLSIYLKTILGGCLAIFGLDRFAAVLLNCGTWVMCVINIALWRSVRRFFTPSPFSIVLVSLFCDLERIFGIGIVGYLHFMEISLLV